ncbi:MAG: response regulator [Candidatus Acidiferrales bacterium]
MPGKILVVDDDPVTCELIYEVLTSAELEAHGVTDSCEAAAQLQQHKFDAAFLDVRMPSPDGMQLTRQIRASVLNRKTLVVMITGDTEKQLLTRAFEVGVDFVLFKPVDRQAILRLLRVTRGTMEQHMRRFTRVKACRKVSIESNQERAEGMTIDLSVSGMLVRANRVFPVGSLVQVSVGLDALKPALRGTARVVRLAGDDSMGIEFKNLSASENERLQEFLAPLILKESEEARNVAS